MLCNIFHVQYVMYSTLSVYSWDGIDWERFASRDLNNLQWCFLQILNKGVNADVSGV